jgi:SAM-dependent methyltransferase
MKPANRKCPVCGHAYADVLHSQRFILPEGHPLTDGYDVVCCEQCGFVYADTAVPQAEYDRFYAQNSKYEDPTTGTGGMENSWDRRRQEETAQQIHAYLKGAPASILDVGCANGGLLKALKDLGHENSLGIDPSPVCVENARRLGVYAKSGSLFQPFEHEPFDLVILSHTLEHVQDLASAAKWIRGLMKESATVYIETPDASRYADFIDAPFQDFNTEHINHFSTTCLNNYLKRNGFEPVSWGRKVIPASANKPYPAIYCFAKPARESLSIEKDADLRQLTEIYIERSRNILNEINARLNAALAKSKRVIVWGTGQFAMKLLAETALANAEIAAFVDSNPIHHGKILLGTKIIPPEAVRGLDEPILIASTLHQQSISDQIRNMGLGNPLILLKDS